MAESDRRGRRVSGKSGPSPKQPLTRRQYQQRHQPHKAHVRTSCLCDRGETSPLYQPQNTMADRSRRPPFSSFPLIVGSTAFCEMHSHNHRMSRISSRQSIISTRWNVRTKSQHPSLDAAVYGRDAETCGRASRTERNPSPGVESSDGMPLRVGRSDGMPSHAGRFGWKRSPCGEIARTEADPVR